MPTYAAFLRGMNVGGHRITNADLARAMADLGFTELGTFLASGNLHFVTDAADAADPADLEVRIEDQLEQELGYAVPTLVRTAPSAAKRRALLALASDDDRLALDGRELYWLPKAGISDAAIDLMNPSLYTGPATMRTMRTVERLAARL